MSKPPPDRRLIATWRRLQVEAGRPLSYREVADVFECRPHQVQRKVAYLVGQGRWPEELTWRTRRGPEPGVSDERFFELWRETQARSGPPLLGGMAAKIGISLVALTARVDRMKKSGRWPEDLAVRSGVVARRDARLDSYRQAARKVAVDGKATTRAIASELGIETRSVRAYLASKNLKVADLLVAGEQEGA